MQQARTCVKAQRVLLLAAARDPANAGRSHNATHGGTHERPAFISPVPVNPVMVALAAGPYAAQDEAHGDHDQ